MWIAAFLHRQIDLCLSMGALSPGYDVAAEIDPAILAEVDRNLGQGSYGGAFSQALETHFTRATQRGRQRLFVRVTLLGVLVYNLFLPVDAVVVPDVFILAAVLQLMVVSPCALLAIAATNRFPSASTPISIATMQAMVLATIVIFMSSHSRHIELFPAVFGLFALAANLMLGLAFRWSALISMINLLMVGAAVLLHPGLSGAARCFALAVNGAATYYALVGNYRIDAGLRHAYLFTLRETFRAHQLSLANGVLRDLATIDGLTGVANRRSFDAALNAVWQAGSNVSVGLLMIDIDHFKRLNDRFGHLAGDECLRAVAQTLQGAVRGETDRLTRYGGEEFALLIEGADRLDAASAGERMRRAVAEMEPLLGEVAPDFRLTVSVGCGAIVPGPGNAPIDLIGAADSALYAAKQAGRNCVRAMEALALPAMVNGPPLSSHGLSRTTLV